MAIAVPLKRKLEIAIAGYLLDLQAAEPTFLPGHTIVCATTGLCPDLTETPPTPPVEPALPYTSVGCRSCKERADFPPGYGIKDAVIVIYSKAHASDETRAAADAVDASVEGIFEDPGAILAALNQPASSATPDTRRQKALYLTSIEDVDSNDDHSETTWEDETSAHVVCQGFDPAYE